MHITSETFHTINLRQWESTQVVNELAQLLADGDLNIEDYPALDTLFGAIIHLSGTEASVPISPEQQPGDGGPTVTVTVDEEADD